ncbi:MAG: hypothetical protein L6Q76_02040 [Polyangiaceae bacterium]|nr:hypothetical protein [Polyangiaceae bacterium]
MSDSKENGDRAHEAPAEALAADPRLPYEAPKLVKKRAVVKATLLTAMGPSMTGLTMSG